LVDLPHRLAVSGETGIAVIIIASVERVEMAGGFILSKRAAARRHDLNFANG
jgi:hypothetical protein